MFESVKFLNLQSLWSICPESMHTVFVHTTLVDNPEICMQHIPKFSIFVVDMTPTESMHTVLAHTFRVDNTSICMQYNALYPY
jgi:hypothetical protein